MRKTGIVKSDGKNAEVAIIRETACGENCAECKGCTPSETVIIADNELGAQTGEKVVLEMQDKNAITAAFVAYIIPLAVLLAASGIVAYMGLGEGMSALLGYGAMAVCFLAIRRITSLKADKFKVKIVDILS